MLDQVKLFKSIKYTEVEGHGQDKTKTASMTTGHKNIHQELFRKDQDS